MNRLHIPKAALMPLTRSDVNKAKELLKRPYICAQTHWADEVTGVNLPKTLLTADVSSGQLTLFFRAKDYISFLKCLEAYHVLISISVLCTVSSRVGFLPAQNRPLPVPFPHSSSLNRNILSLNQRIKPARCSNFYNVGCEWVKM